MGAVGRPVCLPRNEMVLSLQTPSSITFSWRPCTWRTTPHLTTSTREVTFAADVRESLEAFGVHLSIFTVQKHHDYVVVGTTVGKIDPVMSARMCTSGRMGLYPPTCTLSRRFCSIVMLRGLHKRGPLASVSVPSSCTSVWEPKPGRLVWRRSLSLASGSCL